MMISPIDMTDEKVEKPKSLWKASLAIIVVILIIIAGIFVAVIITGFHFESASVIRILGQANKSMNGTTFTITSVDNYGSNPNDNQEYIKLKNLCFIIKNTSNNSVVVTFNSTLATLVNGVNGVSFTDTDQSGTLSVNDTVFISTAQIHSADIGTIANNRTLPTGSSVECTAFSM